MAGLIRPVLAQARHGPMRPRPGRRALRTHFAAVPGDRAAHQAGDLDGAGQPVFMETVAQMRAAEPGVSEPCSAWTLGWAAMAAASNTGWSNSAVSNTRFSCNFALGVEADEQRIALIDSLQPVHPVADGDPGIVGLPVRGIDPACPAAPAAAASRFRRGAERRDCSDSGRAPARPLFAAPHPAAAPAPHRHDRPSPPRHRFPVSPWRVADLHLAIRTGDGGRAAVGADAMGEPGAVRRATYSCEPPVTVYHCGWPVCRQEMMIGEKVDQAYAAGKPASRRRGSSRSRPPSAADNSAGTSRPDPIWRDKLVKREIGMAATTASRRH